MATTTQPSMENIEQRRLQLEENVAKLTKALQHWSTWEVEYAMLKEELEKADSPSTADMVEIGRDLDGTLVNEKEVQELLGKDLKIKRTANQVVDMISRRIDYVQQNRSTVEKQLEKVEKQLEGVSILADPGLTNEEGLPMMDIEEELDENDEVKSSSVSQPGRVAPELMNALRKAGVYKAEQDKSKPKESTAAASSKSETSSGSVESQTRNSTSKSNSAEDQPVPTKAQPQEISQASESSKKKKSVAFAEDVDVKTFEKQRPESPTEGKKLDLRAWNLKPGSRVYELGDDEEISATHIIPEDESLEDAELRRDMLQYGLEEVGQVVGEMDLDGDFDYSDEDSEESEEEDEHGRSTRSVLTDDYRQQMMELEKKLNARMVENVGPRPDLHPLAEVADDVRSLRIRKDDEFDESMNKPGAESTTQEEKKSVSFADAPNGADASPSVAEQPDSSSPPAPTIADTIVERTNTVPQPPSAPSKPAKVSRFKSARAASTQPPPVLPNPPIPEPPALPTGPKGRTLANTVVEHTPEAVEHHAPDEFDPVLLNREITTEYHKMRNKMIQQQGGFKETEAEADNPLMEVRDGKQKKVSRFMAARLKAEGL
ncbi:hypothetical protein DM02DRAFT_614094 [Periconia macrospinosa]|uniref:DUF3835 domain-containing protein n=1 Tax=Periconia macrospinosa TaxID=97972 RepID=A0A2V1DUB2_9PLEO|nr:hypothetical protein DM02DRAFT_614094 [Periconia macrospinosa]